jgi:multiple sugar transport system substrate-binding protein
MRAPPVGPVTVVFRHQPLWGDPAPLPNASAAAREMFLTALEGGADDFDVFAIDVVWAPEFARAGWLADLSGAFPPQRLRQDFLEHAVEAVTLEGRVYAVPWYLDVGLLYYRTDLVPRAPRTHAELGELARSAISAASVVATLPLAALTLLFQRRIVAGLTAGAVKE